MTDSVKIPIFFIRMLLLTVLTLHKQLQKQILHQIKRKDYFLHNLVRNTNLIILLTQSVRSQGVNQSQWHSLIIIINLRKARERQDLWVLRNFYLSLKISLVVWNKDMSLMINSTVLQTQQMVFLTRKSLIINSYILIKTLME